MRTHSPSYPYMYSSHIFSVNWGHPYHCVLGIICTTIDWNKNITNNTLQYKTALLKVQFGHLHIIFAYCSLPKLMLQHRWGNDSTTLDILNEQKTQKHKRSIGFSDYAVSVMKLKHIHLMKHCNKAQFVKFWINNELYTTAQYCLNTLLNTLCQQGCIQLSKVTA